MAWPAMPFIAAKIYSFALRAWPRIFLGMARPYLSVQKMTNTDFIRTYITCSMELINYSRKEFGRLDGGKWIVFSSYFLLRHFSLASAYGHDDT